jgi:tight adherence protein B
MVADEAPEPVATEFRQTFEEQRFGLPFDDSLLALAERMASTDARILVTAITIHRQVGGNLAEILDNIAFMVRERFKLRRQLRVITAQGRLSGYVLAALPIVLGLALWVLNPEYMLPLLQEDTGRYLLAGAAVFQVVGYLWIRRILDIEL